MRTNRTLRMKWGVARIPEGATEVECEDWDTGGRLIVPLDSAISAAANAAQLYKKARKQRRAADSIRPLLAAAEGQVPPSPAHLTLQQQPRTA